MRAQAQRPQPCKASESEILSDSAENVCTVSGHRKDEGSYEAKKLEKIENSTTVPFTLFSSAALVFPAIAEATSYSQASYYTSLGLFILSVPGVWSLIKRSTKSKIVKKTFLVDGPAKPNSKPLNTVAGEITSFFTRNNYKVADRGEVVTFEGILTPSRSQASFLVFCSLLSLASIALVLTITVPDVGENWYWLTVLSPLSGVYYWTKASRKEEIKVKMVVADDESTADVVVQGDDAEVERMRKELALMEKGMIYVKGILE